MATLTFSRSSATNVAFTASGLTTTHTYSLQVYGGSKWYDKVTGLVGSTSYTKFFTVDSTSSYQARLWDVTISGVAATGTIPAWDASTDVTVMIYNYLNGSNTLVNGSYTGKEGSTFSIQASGTQYQTYIGLYTFQYYALSSEGFAANHGANVPITIKSGLSVRVYWKAQTYQYATYVYVDGSLAQYYATVSITNEKIRVSDIQGYSDYVSTYDFQYATANSGTTEYAYYSQIPLNADSITAIRLYFKSKSKAVKPTISGITTTATSATVSWSKNGGTYGTWQLYYGTSISSMQSAGQISSSPATVSGLTPGTAYIFYIQNIVSSSDTARSDNVSATTQKGTDYFAWTSDDSTKIAAGQPIRNLTAVAWNNLISKVAACGGNSSSIYSASSGSRITANHFNSMRNAISGLSGAGSVPSSVTAGSSKILASMFIGLKSAINRAISYQNNK